MTKDEYTKMELTRNGTKGLELTREEVIDVTFKVSAIIRKAQCREVNGEVLDLLEHVVNELIAVDNEITDILELSVEK